MTMNNLFKTGIRPAVDAWLIAKSKEKRDYGEYWSASSAGYCMRKVMFDRLGVPSVIDDARKQRVFTSGHLFHDWLQGITKESGLSIAQELELQDEELMIRGHIDDLVLVKDYSDLDLTDLKVKPNAILPIKQHLILYDYKTQNSRAFNYKRPMSYYHHLQLGTYMYMLRKDYRSDNQNFKSIQIPQLTLPELTEARILKMDKDTLRMNEEQLMWSTELESEVLSYWTGLNTYWKNKKLPPCTCADQEGGFMAKPNFNPYFYKGKPCSLEWLKEWRAEMKKITPDVMKSAEEAFGK